MHITMVTIVAIRCTSYGFFFICKDWIAFIISFVKYCLLLLDHLLCLLTSCMYASFFSGKKLLGLGKVHHRHIEALPPWLKQIQDVSNYMYIFLCVFRILCVYVYLSGWNKFRVWLADILFLWLYVCTIYALFMYCLCMICELCVCIIYVIMRLFICLFIYIYILIYIYYRYINTLIHMYHYNTKILQHSTIFRKYAQVDPIHK